jgi:hypothetical protein
MAMASLVMAGSVNLTAFTRIQRCRSHVAPHSKNGCDGDFLVAFGWRMVMAFASVGSGTIRLSSI